MKKTEAEKRVRSVFVAFRNFKSHGQGGPHWEGKTVQRFERGERVSHAPIWWWWKGFPKKGLEEQLPEYREGG